MSRLIELAHSLKKSKSFVIKLPPLGLGAAAAVDDDDVPEDEAAADVLAPPLVVKFCSSDAIEPLLPLLLFAYSLI